MLTANESRTLVLVMLVLVGLTGCSVRSPDVEPALVRVDPAVEQVQDAPASKDGTRHAAQTEEEQSQDEEEVRAPSLTDWRDQLTGPARMAEPQALGRAMAVFYRMRSRAFMAPVVSHVQGAVNLGGVGGDLETRRCPDGGVFHLEWQGQDGARSGARELLYQFEACRGHFGNGPLLVLNGHYRRDFQPRVSREQVIETFDVHGFIGEGSRRQRIVLRGQQQIQRPAEGGVVRDTERMEMLKGGTYTALRDVHDAIVPEEDAGDSDFASFDTRFVTTLGGRLVSSELGGWVDISTATGLVEQQAPCSASGVVALSGKRDGEVRFGPQTGTHHRVALELAGGETAWFKSCSSFGQAFGFDR
ncbi:hypothetical protein ACMDCT_00045 [Halomonadaceae bacterium KBTZ08]